MFRPNMQRQKHIQQGFSRAFAPGQNANQWQRSHNDSIQNDSNLQHMPSQNTSSSRAGRATAHRGSSVVRGEGRVFGRGRAMSTYSPANLLEQGLNESLFGSQHVSNHNQAQGIFTRQQKYSSRFKPNQGSSQKDARPSFTERSHKAPSALKQSVPTGQQQNVSKPAFGAPQKDARPAFHKQPFSMPQSSAFDFTCTPQKPGFGGIQQQKKNDSKPASSAPQKDAKPSSHKPSFSMPRSAGFNFTFTLQKPGFGGVQQQQAVFDRPSSGDKALHPSPAQPSFGGDVSQHQQQLYFGSNKSVFGGKTSTLLGAAQHQPPFGGNARAVQQPIMTPEHTTKKSFVGTDAENIAPTDPRKKQHTENQQHPKEAVFGKRNLNPQAVPFGPENHIGMQALNPQATPLQPAKFVGERGLNPQATPFKPVESNPRPNQHGTNESRPETPKAPEATADPIIGQQRFETFIKRTAKLTEFARQKALQDKEEQKRRQMALQEKLRLEEEQKIMARKEKEEQEKVRRLEAEALKRRQEEERKRKANEECIKEIATIYKMKQTKMLKFIQEKSKPWLSRSRHTIENRNAFIAKRGDILRFSVKLHNSNPYSGFKIDNLYKRYKLRTPEIMEDRAKIALQSEEIAKEFNVYKSEEELLSYVWRKENFNGFSYREVAKKLRQPQIKGKHAWTHLISCDPTATNSTNWFTHKFDLDNEFRRKTSRYEEVDITTKLVDSTEQLSPKLNNEVEAITYVLPEKRVENERHDNAFWQPQRDRLVKLIEALSKDRPDFQCPLLITYYSDDISDVHDTLYNIPELLGFKDEKTITDYHVLLMRKESITTRICDETFWLFGASVNC